MVWPKFKGNNFNFKLSCDKLQQMFACFLDKFVPENFPPVFWCKLQVEIRFSVAMARAIPSHIQNLRKFFKEEIPTITIQNFRVIGKILSLSFIFF